MKTMSKKDTEFGYTNLFQKTERRFVSVNLISATP